jgi:hypothetical protein
MQAQLFEKNLFTPSQHYSMPILLIIFAIYILDAFLFVDRAGKKLSEYV